MVPPKTVRVIAAKGDKVEEVARGYGLIVVAKISNKEGSRLIVTMNLEDHPEDRAAKK